jgi:hypothetical protein
VAVEDAAGAAAEEEAAVAVADAGDKEEGTVNEGN